MSALRGVALSRDKSDTLLLLGAALLVLVPHTLHLPLWISLLCGATLAWRGVVTFRGTRMPSKFLLLPVALAAMGGVFASFNTLLGRDAGVAMLVLLVAFKTLEMRARGDLFVVIFLCLFLVLTNFFYSQSIGTALLMVVSVTALLAAQLSFQFTGAVPPLRRRLLMGAKVVGLAAPLALALFVLFPRVQGPLWGLPGDAAGGRSGLSDSMAPGNLSSLAMSQEPAFRVRFIDPLPAQEKLYWRGVVLGDFDGRTWTRVRHALNPMQDIGIRFKGSPIRHEITLEPHNKRWLFALDLPRQLPTVGGSPSHMTPELELNSRERITTRVRYEAVSFVDYALQAERLDDSERWLALPRGFNPQAMQAGLDLQRHSEPAARVRAVLEMFAKGSYSYTLEPSALGRDSVDQFLYQTRAGFCEHYASAFVFLMRAADVPARVVTGYQGGERNPVDGYVTVTQADAHAWAEVWLAGHGWIRVDPTAAVAPNRVQLNSARAKEARKPFGFEGLSNLMNFEVGGSTWLTQLRFRIGALNNSWNQWVLNYTPERQQGVLQRLQNDYMNARTAGVAALLVLALLLWRAIRLRAEKDPIDALYSALCQRMGRLGMARASDEGPSAYALRLSTLRLAPEKKAAIARFLHLYSAHKYGPKAPDPALAATLKSLLKHAQ